MFKKNSTFPPMFRFSQQKYSRYNHRNGFRQVMRSAFFSLALLSGVGCRTVSLPPANFSEPGWKIQEGQAVYRQKTDAPEIAGELLFATNSNGRTILQFTKTPFPFVVAQTTPRGWQLEIPAQNKRYSGPGTPPKRIGWFHLPTALKGFTLPEPWIFQKSGEENWRLENTKTGERIEGFLAP